MANPLLKMFEATSDILSVTITLFVFVKTSKGLMENEKIQKVTIEN